MKVYQLVAYGYIAFNGMQYSKFSKTVYRNRNAAQAAMPEFVESVTTPKNDRDLNYMNRENLKPYIEQLDLK